MAKLKITPKQTLTKVCGIAYDYQDIERVIDFCNKHTFNYYIMKHTPEESEEETKEHWHFIIESDTKHRFIVSSLLTETFKINLFEPCSNVGYYLRYMTHCDYALKKHYSIDEFISNVCDISIKCLIEQAENNSKSKQERNIENFYAVIQAIELEGLYTIPEILKWCKENDIIYDLHWTYTLKCYISDYSRSAQVTDYMKELESIKLN